MQFSKGKYIILILATSLVTVSGFRHARPWTLEEERAANNFIREFQDTFQYFASVNDEGKGTVFMFKLQRFFEDQRSRHFYDLFEEKNPNSNDVEDYLFTIKNQFHCNMNVEFEPLGLPTHETFKNKQYARYILKKKISYEGLTKEVTNVVMIEMTESQPKIDVIGMPEHFPDGGCQSITKVADQYFIDQNYQKARELYQARVLCSEDKYASQRIRECNNIISSESAIQQLISETDELINAEKYQEALLKVEAIEELDSDNIYASRTSRIINDKISDIKSDEFHFSRGETFEANEQWQKALEAYQQAFRVKQSSELVAKKINDLKLIMQNAVPADLEKKADKLFADKEYEKARSLYLQALDLNKKPALREKVEECDNFIKYQSNLDQARALIDEEKYVEAKKKIELAREYKPNSMEVEILMSIVDSEILFNKQVDLGDYYYNDVQLYNKAILHYNKALEIKPGNKGIALKLKQSENMLQISAGSVEKRANEAVKLFNRKKYAESFKILHPLSDSDMLAPGHYYMLGEIAVANRDNIHKKMGWDKDQGLSIGAYYLSMALGNLDTQISINALKRYCDLRTKTIEALSLEKLNCGKVDEWWYSE
jgi:tetratricopeptide (TPR) repeat protein